MVDNGGNRDDIDTVSGPVFKVELNDGKGNNQMRDFVAFHIKKTNWEHPMVCRAFAPELVMKFRLDGEEAYVGKEIALVCRKRPVGNGGTGFYRDIIKVEEAYARQPEEARSQVAVADLPFDVADAYDTMETPDTAPTKDKDAYLACPSAFGEAYNQWHMDRRTALMQSEGEGLQQIVQAEILFQWLRGWLSPAIQEDLQQVVEAYTKEYVTETQ